MEIICQSCAMPIEQDEMKGTNADGSKSNEYCNYCYQNGKFTSEATMEEMIEICIPPTIKVGVYKDEKSARDSMLAFFPSLNRWKK